MFLFLSSFTAGRYFGLQQLVPIRFIVFFDLFSSVSILSDGNFSWFRYSLCAGDDCETKRFSTVCLELRSFDKGRTIAYDILILYY